MAPPAKKCTQRAGCELCGGAAAVHCEADSAFLCLSCDAKVHGANFLASRHLRRRLDASDDDDARSRSSSASGSCVSTADSAAGGRGTGGGRRPRRTARAEAVLEGWAKRMGFAPGVARAGPRRLRRARPSPRCHGRRALVGGRRRGPPGGRPPPRPGGQRARAGEAGRHGGVVDGARRRGEAEAVPGPGRRGGLGRVLLSPAQPGPTQQRTESSSPRKQH